jgi:DNA-binding SARP family transcriptional activator
VGTAEIAGSAAEIRFSVLGPIRAWRAGAELDVGPRQQRLILALLLVRAGRPVDIAEFIRLLWADNPPVSAVNVVHRYVGMLRRLLEPGLPARSSGRWLLRVGTGYRVAVDDTTLDLLTARRLAAEARTLAAHPPADGADAAVAVYTRALELWKGPCGVGLDPAAQLHPAFVAIDRECSVLTQEAADTALACGLGRLILPALRRATERDPLDEALQARLLRCLAVDGKQAEALAGYDAVRRRLAGELGVDPGPELLAAHRHVLEQSAGTPAAGGGATGGAESLGGPAPDGTVIGIRPAQLPADLPLFTGRRAELARLDELLTPAGRAGRTAVTVAVDGMPGVGKSTLAVHWAHRASTDFPDGQLFLDLRGFDGGNAPTSQAEALHTLLSALGMPARQIPADVDARAGLYRSMLAGRRMLVILDNARDAQQAGPLLPGAPGCAAIVTSRTRLTGLAVHGAASLTVELPGVEDARATLRARLGARRAGAEPAALDAIIASCGRLPLALAVVAARAHGNPAFGLAAIARELRTTHDRLDALTGDDVGSDVRAVFSWSHRALRPPAARLFRLLSLHHGPTISVAAAASVAGVHPRAARGLLGELTRARLLTEHLPGRFAVHDLIRAYAAELAWQLETPAERGAALDRLIAHYLHTAQLAQRWLDTGRSATEPPTPPDGVTGETIGDHDEAIRMLATVSAAVTAQVRTAGR